MTKWWFGERVCFGGGIAFLTTGLITKCMPYSAVGVVIMIAGAFLENLIVNDNK